MHAFSLPETMDPLAAAPLLCAGVIGYRSLKVSGVRPGDALGLFGFGASAHLAIQVALRWNCRVYVFTREEEHRRHALDLGARWAGPIEEMSPELLHAAITFANLYHERGIRSVANLTRADVREFLGLAVREPFRVSVNAFPLEGANDALAPLRTSAFLGSAVLDLSSKA